MINSIRIEGIKQIAKKAGKAIMEIYNEDYKIKYKDDSSPLTEADKISNNIICGFLKKQYPKIPILSEENKEITYLQREKWEYYWCIDPIDGTKEFIKKNGEFTINIALIHKNRPVLGIVYAPALELMYYAKQKEGAYLEIFENDILINKRELLNKIEPRYATLNIVASKSHLSAQTQQFIDELSADYGEIKIASKGSSLKLCMIADGSADIYPRLAPTMEWDTAAADAIVRESGKKVYIYDKNLKASDYLNIGNTRLKTLLYNKSELLNPYFVVA